MKRLKASAVLFTAYLVLMIKASVQQESYEEYEEAEIISMNVVCDPQNLCDFSPCLNGGSCHPMSDQEGRQAYTCKCEKDFFGDNCENTPPIINLHVGPTYVEENTNITLPKCHVIGIPIPEVTWSKVGGSLPLSVVEEGELKLLNVTKQDSGVYKCKASNKVGKYYAKTSVEVIQFPIKPPEVLNVTIDADVSISCSATGEIQPKITWLKSDGELPTGRYQVLADGTLTLTDVQEEDAGRYVCMVSIGKLKSLAIMQLNVFVPLTCSEIKNRDSSTTTGSYVINPDGRGGLAPFTVFCDMGDQAGVGVTVISHDSESRTLVDGFEDSGSYARDVTYTGVSLAQLASLTRLSGRCEQFIKYECSHSSLLVYMDGWWVSGRGTRMHYWGGAPSDSGKCACGLNNTCADRNFPCNCDKNDYMWREDSGLLTRKSDLPVSQLRFGDTGSLGEKGYHTLGKLKCYGYECHDTARDWHQLYNSSYTMFLEPEYSYEAQSSCEQLGASLLTIHSAEENAFVKKIFLAPFNLESMLALQDSAKNGTFTWADNSAVDYTNWKSGEPNYIGFQDCAYMYAEGTWNNIRCLWARKPYVCEKTIDPHVS